jgi:RNA polymerase sigma-70 factor (ECF subfamily)
VDSGLPADEDAPLLALAQAGQMSAFEKLVEKHRDMVFGVALRMTRSEADAAEISQEAFLSAYRNLPNFRGDASFGSWVHRIAANTALMRLRHRRVVSTIEEPLDAPQFNERGSLVDTIADWHQDAESLSLDKELRGAIDKAQDGLPEDYRQVFLLRDVDGLSYEQIAEITGDSIAAIKSRLHRARLAMRAAIDGFYQDRE